MPEPTPGDWTASRVVWLDEHDGGHRHVAIDGPDYNIALVQCDEDDAEQLANVTLLSHAKVLRGILQDALTAFDTTKNGADFRMAFQSGTIRAVLAKLTVYCPTHNYNPPPNSGFAFCPHCEFPEEMANNSPTP